MDLDIYALASGLVNVYLYIFSKLLELAVERRARSCRVFGRSVVCVASHRTWPASLLAIESIDRVIVERGDRFRLFMLYVIYTAESDIHRFRLFPTPNLSMDAQLDCSP